MRLFSQASFIECSNPRLCRLLLCIIPIPSSFPNPHHSHHIGSSAYLGSPCLRPSNSVCHMRSFAHLGVALIRTIIPTTHPYFLSLPVAVLIHFHLPTAPPPPFIFPRESTRVARSCFSVSSWRYHPFLLHPPTSYHLFLANTSNKGLSATHCATVAFSRSM